MALAEALFRSEARNTPRFRGGNRLSTVEDVRLDALPWREPRARGYHHLQLDAVKAERAKLLACRPNGLAPLGGKQLAQDSPASIIGRLWVCMISGGNAMA